MSFDGKSRSRTVSYRGASATVDAPTLVETARKERERRENDRRVAHAVHVIAVWYLGRAAWRRLSSELRGEFDRRMADIARARAALAAVKRPFAVPLKNAVPLLRSAALFITPRAAGDVGRLQAALELLAESVASTVEGITLSGLLLSRETAGTWVQLVRCACCCLCAWCA